MPIQKAESSVVLPKRGGDRFDARLLFGNLSSQLICQTAVFDKSGDSAVFRQSGLQACRA